MGYVGLIPTEPTSGETRRRGPITRTGNAHVRRLLVESAWPYRLIGRGKHPAEAARAVARELAGFIWAIGREEPLVAVWA